MNKPPVGGMQVHGVPDDERVLDSQGRKLPWGYSYADPSLNPKLPAARGPFGKNNRQSTLRRSASRSKTAPAPTTKEELVRLENQKVQDDIFGKFKSEIEEKHGRATARGGSAEYTAPLGGTTKHELIPIETTKTTATISQQQQLSNAPAPRASNNVPATLAEPTEVYIYGFLPTHQPQALSFYETASRGGCIYEDYDRAPRNSAPRFNFNNTFAAVAGRARRPRTLPPATLRKINEYKGGNHWVKVTFDSAQSAELATSESPHIIGGCAVYAELWRGNGPAKDRAIPASEIDGDDGSTFRTQQQYQAATGAQRDWRSLPARGSAKSPEIWGDSTSSTSTAGANSSSTAGAHSSSSATASGSEATVQAETMAPHHSNDGGLRNRVANPATSASSEPATTTTTPSLRVRGATRIQLRSADSAYLPSAPWTTRTFGGWPIIGSLFASQKPAPQAGPVNVTANANGRGSGVIGSSVPRTETGAFDWASASWWWRGCWWVDYLFGTDVCGLKGED